MSIHIIMKLSESMSGFCRANMNRKTNLPIRSSEMGVLIFIQEKAQEKGVRLVEISDYFGIQKSSVSTIIHSLEQNGYIYKTTLSTDKRSSPLFVTEKGIQLVNETIEDYHTISKKISDAFGIQDSEAFIRLLERATDIIQNGGNKS